MSRPTLRDVAAKAGLSVTQVSRALNDHDDVAESTKELARKVAAELRYTPNLQARRLKDPAARSGAIGIILPSDSLRFSDPFFGDLLSAMVAEAATHGLSLTLSTHPAGRPETEPYDLAIRSDQVDGFVLLRTTTDDSRIDFLLDAEFPFVAFGRPDGIPGFAAVEAPEDCFDAVVDHLSELRHTRVACLAEPSRFAIGGARLRAFRRAADERGLHVADADLIETGFHEGSGFDAATTLLQREHRPTAIVAMNDLLALGALEAATALDIAVPRELSVVGFDDIGAARLTRPALTTVRQDAASVGTALIELLLPAIQRGAPEQAEHRLTTSLVVRESSGRVADRGKSAPTGVRT